MMEVLLDGKFLAIVGVVIVSVLCGAGSAKGVGLVGEAAAGVVSEKPDRFVQTLILQVLPGTQGIYGLLVAFMVLNQIGMLGGGDVEVSTLKGFMYLAACLPMAFVGYISARAQGKAAAGGVGIVANRPEELLKGIIFAAMVETYAVLALLITLLMIIFIK